MLDQWIDRLSGTLKLLSAACLGAMMLTTCADVLGRAIDMPILGAVEITALFATMALSFSLPYAHRQKAHIGVEILTMRLRERSQVAVRVFTGSLSLGLFGVIAWQSFRYATQMRASGELSLTLQLPYYIVIYFISASFCILALVQLAELLKDIGFVFSKRSAGS